MSSFAKEKYIEFWESKLDLIQTRMQLAVITKTEQKIKLEISDLEKLGNRDSSGYAFSLEFSKKPNGVFINNISNSDVASDLVKVIVNSEPTSDLLDSASFIFDFQDTGDMKITASTEQITVHTSPEIKKKPKKERKSNRWYFLENHAPKIIGVLVGLALAFFIFKDKSSCGTNSKTYAQASVRMYLRNNYLKDPGSYKAIEWSVSELSDGVYKYKVRHKYRTKNSFGGYVVEEQVFYLDDRYNVLYVDYY
jgi:hypothetical protein